jgi:hypothetical protein
MKRKAVKSIDGSTRWVKVIKQKKPKTKKPPKKKPSKLDYYLSIVNKNKKKDYYKL